MNIDMPYTLCFTSDLPKNVFTQASTIPSESVRGARQLKRDLLGFCKAISLKVQGELKVRVISIRIGRLWSIFIYQNTKHLKTPEISIILVSGSFVRVYVLH